MEHPATGANRTVSTNIIAQVAASPALVDLLEFPIAVQEARRFAADPTMEGTAFRSGLQAAIAAEENLSFAAVRRWLNEYFGSYQEQVVDTARLPIDLLSIDIHVPHIDGATAMLEVVRESSTSGSFIVTLLGSGGGAKQTAVFSVDNGLEVSACTRQTFSSEATWELVAIIAGPDTGHRFHRMVAIDENLLRTETTDVGEDRCETPAGATTRWLTFDYRVGSVVRGTPKLKIARTDAWLGRTGLKLPSFGMEASVDSEVVRNVAIEVAYSLPGGHLYEAHRVHGAPFPWWRLS